MFYGADQAGNRKESITGSGLIEDIYGQIDKITHCLALAIEPIIILEFQRLMGNDSDPPARFAAFPLKVCLKRFDEHY